MKLEITLAIPAPYDEKYNFFESVKHHGLKQVLDLMFNPFKLEFTIVIFVHYKPRIAVAILDLYWTKLTCCGWKIKENVLVNQFHGNFPSKT